MRIKPSLERGELYLNNEVKFIGRAWYEVINDDGTKIGNITGHRILMPYIKKDFENENGRNSFLEMDQHSQLLCNLWEYINSNFDKLTDGRRVYFLNNISLLEDYNNIETHKNVLIEFLKNMDTIIYSLGSTELDDEYFNENLPEEYWEQLESSTKDLCMHYDQTFDFYLLKRENIKISI